MAQSSSQVLIGLQINLRGQVKLDQLNAALRLLRTTTTAFHTAMLRANQTFGKFTQTSSDAAKNMKVLQAANAALASANAKLGASQGRVQSSQTRLTKAQRDAIQANREAVRLDNLKITSSDNLVQRLRKVETAYDSIFRAGFRLKMLGDDMKQLGEKVLGALGGIASEFGDFEFMVNRAAGAMGILTNEVDGGTNVYSAFQSAILDTASSLRLFKPEDVAKATYFWASTSGQQVNTLGDLKVALEAVNPLMKVAALTQTDYETAIKGVYSILVQYGKGLGDVQDVVEKLQKTTVETAAEFPDLINSFKMVGPIAAANGVSFEDMISLFGKLADAGIRGTMSGRGFRQMFIQLVKPSEQASGALKELWKSTEAFAGQSYTDMVFPKGQYVGVTKYIHMLAVAVKDLTQSERNSLLARITTANELPILTALVGREITAINTNSDAWSKGVVTQETAAQAFKRQWDILATSWNGLVGGLQRGVETIRLLIGKRLAEVFGPVVRDITTKLDELRKWFENQQNGPMIQFFVKMAALAGGFLTAAGYVIAFTGSLTILGAAINVVVRAFGPFAAKVSAIGGIIGGFVSAIQRNFDYIRAAVVSAFNDITSAFGGAEGAIGDATKAFGDFAAATRPIFDFIVRTAADIIRSMGSLVKILMTFGPTAGAIRVVGQALLVIFAARTIANVLGLAKAFGFVTTALRTMVLTTTIATAGTSKLGGALNVAAAAGTGLRGKLSGLVSGMGIGGLLTTVLLVGAALGGMAYETLPAVRDAVDLVAEHFRDFRKDAEDALAALDLWRGDVQASIAMEPEFIAMQKRLNELRQAFSAPGATGDQKLKIDADYNKMLKDLENFKRDYATSWSSLTTELRALHIDVTQEDILKKAQEFQKGLGLETLRQAVPFVTAYFKAIKAGSDTGSSAIDELTKAWNSNALTVKDGVKVDLGKFLDIGLGPGGRAAYEVDRQVKELMSLYVKSSSTGEGFAGWTEAMRKDLLNKLIDMRGQASPELAAEINKMLDTAVRAGMIPDDAAIDDAATGVVKATSSALISAFENLKNFDKSIADAMKKAFRPKSLTRTVWASFISGAISKGFKDSLGLTNYPAQMFAIEQTAASAKAWQAAFDAMTPPDASKFVRDTIRGFNKDFKNGVPKTVPDELRTELQNYMEMVYKLGYGTEVPQSVLDLIWGTSKNAGEHVPKGTTAGVKDPVANKNLQGAVTTMRDDSLAKLKMGTQPYTWGRDFITNFTRGMQSIDIMGIINKITSLIAAYFHFSEPKAGPLRGMHKSGQHFVENWLGGMESMQSQVKLTANKIAESAYLDGSKSFAPQGVSLETSANRNIKVQIEVTSPDGSVDRLKTAQLTMAMQTSDLVMALEHMATVG